MVKRIVFILFLNLSLIYSNCFAYNIEAYPGQVNSESKNRLNLIFCSLNYENNDDFTKDREMLIQRLKQTRPFDEFSNLRLWYINISREEEGAIFNPVPGLPPLNLRKDFLGDILAKLKSNYKLIIIDARGSLSCAEFSSIEEMSLIILGKGRYKDANSFAKGFLHELGHSLGLRDEGLNSEATLCPPGPPNCAVTEEEAKNWWGDLIGSAPRVHYIRGCCGNKSYIRPTIASLMNNSDKAEDFGPVNERYLRNILKGGY